MLSSFCCLQTKKDCREVCACNCLNEPGSPCVLGGYHPSLIKPYISRGSTRYKSECLKGCLDFLFLYIFFKDRNWFLSTSFVSCSHLRILFFDSCSSCQAALKSLRPSFILSSFVGMTKQFLCLPNLNCF